VTIALLMLLGWHMQMVVKNLTTIEYQEVRGPAGWGFCSTAAADGGRPLLQQQADAGQLFPGFRLGVAGRLKSRLLVCNLS
jgi:hypothetical protein